MSNAIIRAELETRLKTWADAQNPKIPIAFEGVGFEKPASGPFIEALLVPVATIDREIGGLKQRRLGIFQVNCWTRSGSGMGQLEALAQSIVELFPLVPKTGTVSIEATPFADEPYHDTAGWLVVPVTIQYRHES